MSTALSDFLSALDTKLKTCSFVTSADNVKFGESFDVLNLADTAFPRLETMVVKAKGEDYIDQTNLQWAFRFVTLGFIRTTTDGPYMALTEIQQAMNYSKEVADKIFSFLQDSQQGNPPCDGFELLGGFPEIFLERELFPKTITFLVYYEAQIRLSDTETV